MSTSDHIAVLQAQNRLLRRLCQMSGGVSLLLGCLLIAGWNQGIPDVIKARRFEVINDTFEKASVVLTSGEGGGGSLDILNKDGYEAIELGISDAGQDGVLHIREPIQHSVVAQLSGDTGGKLFLWSSPVRPSGKPWSILLGQNKTPDIGLQVSDDKDSPFPGVNVGYNSLHRPAIELWNKVDSWSSWYGMPEGSKMVFMNPVKAGEVPGSNMLNINEPVCSISRLLHFKSDDWPAAAVQVKPGKKGGGSRKS